MMQTWAPLPASGSEAGCSLFEGLEGTPAWLELHSVLRGTEPAREQKKVNKKWAYQMIHPKRLKVNTLSDGLLITIKIKNTKKSGDYNGESLLCWGPNHLPTPPWTPEAPQWKTWEQANINAAQCHWSPVAWPCFEREPKESWNHRYCWQIL